MKKLSLILWALLSVISVSAIENQKQITLTFANDDANGIKWVTDENTVEGNKLTFKGSWKKSYWEFEEPIDVRGFKFTSVERNTVLTFEFIDVNGKTGYEHFWGNGNLGEKIFNFSDCQDCDLTQIKSIALHPRDCEQQPDQTTPYYAEFGQIILTTKTKYDKVLVNPVTNATLFPLTEGSVNTAIFGENTYDASTKTLTLEGDAHAAGWTFDSQDLSSYNKLVIELQENLGFCPHLRIRNQNAKNVQVKTGDEVTNDKTDVFYVVLPSNQTKIEIDLTANQFAYDKNPDGTTVKLDLTDIIGIYFWAWAGKRDIKLKNVYLVSAEGKVEYLVRNNTTAGKYGTICLPFAASLPSNAKIYDVVGIDSKESTKEVYLQEVNSMEAGKGYLFSSTNEQNVLFTKTGDSDDLQKALSSNGLVGTFSETTAPKDSYILVGGKWKKVTADNKNKVGAYRAWLVLDESSVVSKQVAFARGYHAFSLGDGTVTGIHSIKADSAEKVYYTIDGIRTSTPTTNGVYVKDGKKILVTK